MEEALFTKIKNNSTLATMLTISGSSPVAYHIYPLRLPDAFSSTADYALTYTQISEERVYPTLKRSSVQFNCFGRTFLKARNLADALDECLDDLASEKLGGTLSTAYIKVEGKQALYDDVSDLWYFAVDISVKY